MLRVCEASAEIASWYGEGQMTAQGKRFDPEGITCAHKTWPFGTRVLVVDVATGRSVTCVVNDRGPYTKGRAIDLSRGAARQLGIIERGIARVSIERL